MATFWVQIAKKLKTNKKRRKGKKTLITVRQKVRKSESQRVRESERTTKIRLDFKIMTHRVYRYKNYALRKGPSECINKEAIIDDLNYRDLLSYDEEMFKTRCPLLTRILLLSFMLKLTKNNFHSGPLLKGWCLSW